MIMTERRFYTVEEIAELLRVSDETIRKMIARGEIEAVRVGRQYRITQEALDKYLNKK